MGWDVNIDVCALIVMCVLIMLQMSKQYMSIRRSFVFFIMSVMQASAFLFFVVGRCLYLYADMQPNVLLNFLANAFYVTQYMVPLLFMRYMVVWSGRSVREHKITMLLYILPYIVIIIGLVMNAFTHCAYQWNEDRGFEDDSGVIILMAATVYCIIYGVVYAGIFVRKIAFRKLVGVAVIALSIIFVMIWQYGSVMSNYVNYLISVGMLVLYIVAQNQADMIDRNTQVLNRIVLDERIRSNIHNKKRFALVVLAMDDFKFVNKTFGVTAGDMLLLQVARFLATVSAKSRVYRYGADQFALEIAQGDIPLEKVVHIIQERFRHPWIAEDVSVMLSATISCVSYPNDASSVANLIDVVDYSVLSAKAKGKGALVYAGDLDLHNLRKEKAIEKAVENAMKNDTFEVHYQPIFNTEKQCYTSAEALVRLKDDLLGNIPPDVFIPIAEKNGTIVKLGMMIFEKVCKFIVRSNLRDTTIEYIEVNVSVVQCMQKNFVDDLLAIMEKYGVTPDQINLEVTETAAANSLAILQENIEKLHAKGISFSLDDYGSGYSTLGYIHQLPFRIIKLDRLMVWDAFANERAGITLKYTVGMLKELKVRIVAEGVETQEQQSRLEGIGCDYLQGWYYSKAVPENDFLELIKKAS